MKIKSELNQINMSKKKDLQNVNCCRFSMIKSVFHYIIIWNSLSYRKRNLSQAHEIMALSWAPTAEGNKWPHKTRAASFLNIIIDGWSQGENQQQSQTGRDIQSNDLFTFSTLMTFKRFLHFGVVKYFTHLQFILILLHMYIIPYVKVWRI